MPSGLAALLDDVAAIAKLAAASIDDVGAAAGRAGAKAAGVVIDDTAVTPRYVTGFTPDRELPIIARIAKGSLRNKLLILLPAARLLSALLPWAITPLLMLGAAYLCFEGAEKVWEAVAEREHSLAEDAAELGSADHEREMVSGAVRTDFILSAEIMAIALAELAGNAIGMQAAALVVVAVLITVAVYGVVALIVKLDDIGLHLAERPSASARSLGRGLVHVVPSVLTSLSAIGTAAMLWVGGGILVHGLEELQILEGIPHSVEGISVWLGEAVGFASSAVEWLAYAISASIVGLIVGGVIVALLQLLPKRRTEALA
jgi:predicted DNA repair protein MutK